MDSLVCCVSLYGPIDLVLVCLFFFQAEDGIRDLVRSRGLGDVYKRQVALLLRRQLSSSFLFPHFFSNSLNPKLIACGL